MMLQQGFGRTGGQPAEMIEDVSYTLLVCLLLVVVSYACSRAIALAWFRTKLEHFRSILREVNREKRDNGER